VIVKGALNLFFEEMEHLRKELRIENLLDREGAFGGEVFARRLGLASRRFASTPRWLAIVRNHDRDRFSG
jgi:hypothetical protein